MIDMKLVMKAVKAGETKVIGSSTIKGASPKDRDVLILSKQRNDVLLEAAMNNIGLYTNTETDSEYELDESFMVFKDETADPKIDYIVTRHRDMYKKFSDANDLAVKLGLTDKEDRITLFQYILYENLV